MQHLETLKQTIQEKTQPAAVTGEQTMNANVTESQINMYISYILKVTNEIRWLPTLIMG